MMWLLSPIGRWLSAAGAMLTLLAALYMKGRRAGIEALQREQEVERNRRARNAIQADDAVRRDVASGRLYDNDGHRRD